MSFFELAAYAMSYPCCDVCQEPAVSLLRDAIGYAVGDMECYMVGPKVARCAEHKREQYVLWCETKERALEQLASWNA